MGRAFGQEWCYGLRNQGAKSLAGKHIRKDHGVKTVAEISAEALPPLELRPSLWGAFVGMWVLTWRGQLTPKRLWNAVGFLFSIPTIAFLTTDPGNSDQFLDWVLRFHLFLVLPLHCLFVFGPLIRDEIQADTLPFMITRPVQRWRLYLMKFVCAAIVMQGFLLLNGVIFTGVAAAKGLSGLTPLLPLFLLSQAIAALAYGALAGLLGLLSEKFMMLGDTRSTRNGHWSANYRFQPRRQIHRQHPTP